MTYEDALKIAALRSTHRESELHEAFDVLCAERDKAQEALSGIHAEINRRTHEEVKRLKAEIAAKEKA